jgi:hypothetical protein
MVEQTGRRASRPTKFVFPPPSNWAVEFASTPNVQRLAARDDIDHLSKYCPGSAARAKETRQIKTRIKTALWLIAIAHPTAAAIKNQQRSKDPFFP